MPFFMKFKSLFILLFCSLIFSSIFAQNDTNRLSKGRVAVVASSLGVTLSGSYLYIENSWWADKQTSFSFDDGADLTYALNVDKAGHFMGGLLASNMFSNSMSWAGMSEKRSLWLMSPMFVPSLSWKKDQFWTNGASEGKIRTTCQAW